MLDKGHQALSDRVASDEQWMHEAILLAHKAAQQGEVPVGAVVVKNHVKVGEGWNHPIATRDPSAHAEILALRAAASTLDNYRLPGCTLFVTVEPCTMCAGAIVHARLSRVVFGAYEPRAGAVVSRAQVLSSEYLNHKVAFTGGVCEPECRRLMEEFFRHRRTSKKMDGQSN